MAVYQDISNFASKLGIHLDASQNTIEGFEACFTQDVATEDFTLFQQNGVADKLAFLKTGSAQFLKQRQDGAAKLMETNASMTPMGISGLNSPGRYMSEVRVSKGSEYLVLDLEKFWTLTYADPIFGAKFMSLILTLSTELLWKTRGLAIAPSPTDEAPTEGVPHATDYDMKRRLREAAFFAPIGKERLADLLEFAELRLYSKGQVVTTEGAALDGIYFLFSGRIHASFTNARDGAERKQSRTVVRPGVALSWSGGFSDLVAPYTLVATRDTSMLCISSDSIRKLIETDPMLAIVLLQRQLWQLGRYQQTASGLSHYAVEDEAVLMEALLADNSPRVSVQSRLHGVPHALRNRFTRGYALDSVYDAVISGNDAERSIAGLMIDALDGVEREHRFFEQLNAVYARVASAPTTANSVTLRQLSNADFARAFEQVPYVIKGMENLPASPTNIFIYNHIAAEPQNTLANGHSFTVDSHFISAMILHPKYGDGGQRIVRSNRNTEFERSGYYSRLDNIFVDNRESDPLDETPAEKKWRKEKFFIESQKTFDAGRPLSIAPEGTSETPDNLTSTGPSELKPGAFLLGARLSPEPFIVPIALANFDSPVSRTTYAAVIKEPFRVRDFISDVNDRAQMNVFLAEYRETFRGYIAEARELADTVNSNPVDADPRLVTNIGHVSPVEEEFEVDIRELESRVIEQAQQSGKVVLYGSSTFRLWSSAAKDLGIDGLINLGFGGSTLTSCRSYFKRVVVPHSPNTMVFYAGDNDIGSGATGAQVAQEFGLFMSQVAERLPNMKCFVVSIKPSPFRVDFLEEILKANAGIKELVEQNDQWDYIDFNTPMLDKDGSPSPSFYDNDPLHVNTAGYGLLAKLTRDALQNHST